MIRAYCLAGCAVVAGSVGSLLAAPVPDEGPLLVVVAPWHSPSAVVKAAGAAEISPLSTRFATLAFANEPSAIARLRDEGAWLIRNGGLLARICGV